MFHCQSIWVIRFSTFLLGHMIKKRFTYLFGHMIRYASLLNSLGTWLRYVLAPISLGTWLRCFSAYLLGHMIKMFHCQSAWAHHSNMFHCLLAWAHDQDMFHCLSAWAHSSNIIQAFCSVITQAVWSSLWLPISGLYFFSCAIWQIDAIGLDSGLDFAAPQFKFAAARCSNSNIDPSWNIL